MKGDIKVAIVTIIITIPYLAFGLLTLANIGTRAAAIAYFNSMAFPMAFLTVVWTPISLMLVFAVKPQKDFSR